MSDITIVGLGPGSPAQISIGALDALREADHIYFRTKEHPVIPWLIEELGLSSDDYTTFDSIYETAQSFDQVYQEIVGMLAAEVNSEGTVTYAVPGHPAVAETTVTQLLEWAKSAGKSVRIVPSMSCVDAVCSSLGIDPTTGLVIGDAFELEGPFPGRPLLLTQVYSRLIASDVKLKLMDQFDDEHQITVIRAAGIPGEEKIVTIPLYQLDTLPWIDHLTSVYVPAQPKETQAAPDQESKTCAYPLDPLVEVMQRLRAPGGCPWDQVQTHESLRRYLVEETYEVLEAIDQADWEHVKEELGDVLLQVVFHAEIAAESQRFDINDVVAAVTEKLIRRHPHVFGSVHVENAAEVSFNWEKIKERERELLGEEYKSILDGVPQGLPALTRAEKIQRKAAKVGFEWDDITGAMDKVLEELQELLEAWKKEDEAAVHLELGDLLFALVNVARYLDVDPEMALREATDKFITRFHYIEKTAAKQGRELTDMNLEEMDELWNAAKKRL